MNKKGFCNKSTNKTNNSFQQTYADLIVNYLYSIGVRRVFGIPGGAIEPLFNAFARHSREYPYGIKLVIARHESGAAFMAAGYARETGLLGVCCSTTGPGATNLITGVASAYVERDPILIITPQTALTNFSRSAFQDSSDTGVDIVTMFSTCTRFNSLVSHIQQLEGKLYEAIITAFNKPRGPVHLSIPVDILKATGAPRQPSFDLSDILHSRSFFDDVNYKKLISLVEKANKLVIVVGGGCSEGAIKKIIEFAEITNSAIVSTPTGKTWVNAYHPLYRGVFGFAGHVTARNTLMDDNVDVVIALGTSLNELATGAWDQLALLNYKLVHIDSIFENFSQSPMAKLHIHGQLSAVFDKLNNDILKSKKNVRSDQKKTVFDSETWSELSFQQNEYDNNSSSAEFNDASPITLISKQAPVKPQYLMHHLSSHLPSESRYVVDSGNSWAWAIHYLHLRSSGNFRIGLNFGSMTWAISNAIGVASAAPGTLVVCITGDGSMLMSGQEITVAVEQQLPILFVVLNDQALGMIKHGQRLGGGEAIGYQLPSVDFAALARTMGAEGYTANSNADLDQIDFKDIFSRSGPSLLDVYIDSEETPPIGIRMQALDRRKETRSEKVSRRKNKKIEPETLT